MKTLEGRFWTGRSGHTYDQRLKMTISLAQLYQGLEEGRWRQGVEAVDCKGADANPRSSDVVGWCVYGWLKRFALKPVETADILARLDYTMRQIRDYPSPSHGEGISWNVVEMNDSSDGREFLRRIKQDCEGISCRDEVLALARAFAQ